jgi:hypothetical protein
MIRRGKTLILTDKGNIEEQLNLKQLQKQVQKITFELDYLKKEIHTLKKVKGHE